jgi:hypothetical protein
LLLQEVFYLLILGAGSGKSRAGRETKNMLMNAINNKELHNTNVNYKNSIFIGIDYSNGDRIVENETDSSTSLALRIFLKVFRLESVSEFVSSSDEYKYLINYKLLTIKNVMRLLSIKLHEFFQLQLDEDIPIILILDEIQKTKEFFSRKTLNSDNQKEIKNWKLALNSIGDYSVNINGMNINYENDRLLVSTIISGTLDDKDLPFIHPTEYGLAKYPLPVFTFEEIMNTLKILAKDEIIPNWILSPYFHRFWWLMGIIPRTLDVAVENTKLYNSNRKDIEKTNEQILLDIYKNSIKAFESYYLSRYDYLNDMSIILLSCTNLHQETLGNKIDKEIDNGNRTGKLFYNYNSKTFYMPHIIFENFNQTISNSPFPTLPYFNKFNFEDFETIDLQRIASSFSFLFKNDIKTIKLKDIINAGGNEHVLNIDLKVNLRYFREEIRNFLFVNSKDEIIIDSIDEVQVEGNKIKKKDLLNYVFKTKKNCFLIDGRVWLDKKLLLIVQYKFRLPNEEFKTEKNDVLEWVDHVKNSLKYEYKNFKFVYLYVTTGVIPQDDKNKIKASEDNVLYIDRTNIQNYISTNLLPYFLTPSSDEIKILEFIELNNIEKVITRNNVTINDLKSVLQFINVDKSDYNGLKYDDLLSFTIDKLLKN